MAFTRWISIIFVKRKRKQEFAFSFYFKNWKQIFLHSGPLKPSVHRGKGTYRFPTGSTLSTNSKSPFIADIRTRLPHGQVNQEGLDNSWANFNVFISSLFLLKVCEKRNLINNKRGNNSAPRPEANGVNASVNKVKLFSLLKGQK